MSAEATVEGLARELSSYLDTTRINQVRRAYYYAEQAHEGQMRKSGDRYITHPLAVAQAEPAALMLGSLDVDLNAVAARHASSKLGTAKPSLTSAGGSAESAPFASGAGADTAALALLFFAATGGAFLEVY